ncbi:Caspase-1, partial [Orchesella cincta]
TSRDSSLSSNSSEQDANSPASPVRSENSAYITDYTPMAQGNIHGMSYMPTSKLDPNYNMTHPRRGKAIIFNFDRWDNTNIPTLDLPPRLGSQKDKKDLSECLQNLSFQVITHDNLKRQKFDKVLDKLRREDHSDADCLVVAIMTHGEKNTIYLSDGTQLPVNLIWEKFEANACPTLAGKPKIFIIQACRGKRYDHGTRLNESAQSHQLISDVTDFASFSYVIPNAADILVAFSCPLGHYSWRHPESGSWFIQSVCKVFNHHAYEMDLKTMLTSVSREVAVNYESNTNQYDSDKKKQVPSTSSTLIRNVKFSPKPLVTVASTSPVTVMESNAQMNGNVRPISLQQVQEAVAVAVETTEMTEHQTNISEIVPLILPEPQTLPGTTNMCAAAVVEDIPPLMESDSSHSQSK